MKAWLTPAHTVLSNLAVEGEGGGIMGCVVVRSYRSVGILSTNTSLGC